jgi:hypothetical protein
MIQPLPRAQSVKRLPAVKYEILSADVMKSTILWDITPCNPLSVNLRFGGTYRLHLQGRKNKFSKKPAWKLNLFSQLWWWRRYVPAKRRFTFNGQHGVISQNIVLFRLTTMHYTSIFALGPPESWVHRTAINIFAALISCIAVVLTPFLEIRVHNIASHIYQEKVSRQCTSHLHQFNIPLLKCTGHCEL